MSLSPPLPSFERADYEGAPPSADQCAYCHRGITAEYYRVDNNLACPSCAQQAQSLIPPDSHKAYSRAVLFGIGAAIVGCIGYALVTTLTGWTIGYLAIAVGFVVGKAMKVGSRGLGGKRYQVTAAILTYAAVAVAFVPMAMYQNRQDSPANRTPAQPPIMSSATPATPAPPAPASTPAEQKVGLGGFFVAILTLLGIGLISPFLRLVDSPFGGLIGIFIIFIGISTAWRLTQREASVVDGPFEHTPSIR